MSLRSGALAMGRAHAEGSMSEMVRVGVISTGTFDESTGTYPEILTVHYTGPGRIKVPLNGGV